MSKVRQPLERAGELARAAPHHGLRARRGRLADHRRLQRARANLRVLVGLGALRPLLRHDGQDLRDHVAGALQDHRVADADVQARDLVGVVQGGVGDDHAAHGHRRQARHRGEGAGAADLDVDGLQHRARLLRRELPRNPPARGAGDETQAVLPVQAIDLVDHPVDVEGQMGPLGLHVAIGGEQAFDALDALRLRGHLEAPGLQLGQRLPLGLGERRGELAPGVGEEPQRPLGGDPGVDLAQRPGRRVAGVGVGLLPRRLGRGVQRGELLVAEVDLAADLDEVGPAGACEPLGDFGDGADVGGHVLADPAVAPRRRLDQHAPLVADRTRQPVDLWLSRVGDRLVEPQEPLHPRVELHRVLVREGVVEAEHGRPVLDGRELLRARRTHPQARRIVPDQVREARLEPGIAALQGVVVGVRDRRVVLLVIADVVGGDLVGQPCQLGDRVGLAHRLGRCLRHASAPWPPRARRR